MGVIAYIMVIHGKLVQPALFHSPADCTVRLPLSGVAQQLDGLGRLHVTFPGELAGMKNGILYYDT